MKKKISLLVFLSLFLSFLLAEEPVADFSLDMSYFDKKSETSAKKEDEEQETKLTPSKEKGKVFAEPKHKKIGITGTTKEATVKYRNNYLTDANRKWLAEILYDSIPYRPYIREKLKEKKMPLFLQYLPIVESNYKPTAVSRSGATGLWQFMANSMQPYLVKNEYFDERLDPWKETDAALAKLAENYKTFKNWHLALAAYNMGAGAVGRIVKANPGKDFWELSEQGLLSKQASEYVPKLIAIADIVENADFYGALEIGVADKRIDGVKPEKFSLVVTKKSVSLSAIAKAADLPYETVKELNPSLLKDCTPPGLEYSVRLPSGKAKTVAENLKSKK